MRMKNNDPYFAWLCKKVNVSENGNRYELMAEKMHQMIFKTDNLVERDDNRALDGIDMRSEYIDKYGKNGSAIDKRGCTVLEFLVALARRMSFLMTGHDQGTRAGYYFKQMLINLRIQKLDDDRYYELNGDFYVEDAVYRIENRLYEPNGTGGLFPTKHSTKDQRYEEIWYQMHSWLLENQDAMED
jgi:hypothetical protein